MESILVAEPAEGIPKKKKKKMDTQFRGCKSSVHKHYTISRIRLQDTGPKTGNFAIDISGTVISL